ncbi:LacI family transcriptional regulator [Dongia mobilis]|uniref:LacI family transcriptional regulator n=1 Tax=Dongia mobilis TaxID=578943 RepID=A0A4R6WHB2_9PROT|nr:LacI family DNA-binding transcriptional regulator [Dongia mobilis]TDQ77665.1 LacI family transcriptional regulator [Dongia mobilis]
MHDRTRRPTLVDVADYARVSLATVDRVFNRRPGVSPRTVERVEAALVKLGYRPDAAALRLARGIHYNFCFLLPTGGNTFMSQLAGHIERSIDWLRDQNVFCDLKRVNVFDAQELAVELRQLQGRYHGIGVVALDHPVVRDAIDALVEGGAHVVTLVSDVPSSRRHRFIGIDNSAAGRTAATLMGRFLSAKNGRIGVIAGSLALRDHAERLFGFQQVIGSEYPGLVLLPPQQGQDSAESCREITRQLVRENPDLVGIYSIGAGNRGIAEALIESGRSHDIVFIGHELTEFSRRYLMQGIMHAVINQDSGHEARSAARVLLAFCSGQQVIDDQERIRIDIFLRDNLP